MLDSGRFPPTSVPVSLLLLSRLHVWLVRPLSSKTPWVVAGPFWSFLFEVRLLVIPIPMPLSFLFQSLAAEVLLERVLLWWQLPE